eukprot:TRINITY_DN2694_c0_g2_i1.p1 TRINITY_DN2694_c0_g2~~TRINITY_DN2694_c0_g2_i1.p1  ORF type:complete len:1604 (-),score=291.28 TRINITY_DN2694_c0_g2_i1:31015-35826(-)
MRNLWHGPLVWSIYPATVSLERGIGTKSATRIDRTANTEGASQKQRSLAPHISGSIDDPLAAGGIKKRPPGVTRTAVRFASIPDCLRFGRSRCVGLFFLGLESQQDGGRHEDGGVRTHSHTDEQGQGEVVNHAAAEDEECGHHDKSGARGEQRTGQRLVDGDVDGLAEVLGDTVTQVLTDSVEDDDGVVKGVTDDGQERGHNGEVELLIQEREYAHGYENVVDKGHHRSQCVVQLEVPAQPQCHGKRHNGEVAGLQADETEQVHGAGQGCGHDARRPPALLEPAGDIDGDEQHGVEHGFQRFLAQVRTHLGADHFHTLDLVSCSGHRLGQGRINLPPQVVGFNVALRQPHEVLVVALHAEALYRHALVANGFKRISQVGEFNLVLELELHVDAAGKVDAVGRSALDDEGPDAEQYKRSRDNEGDLAEAYEVNVRDVFEDIQAHGSAPGFHLDGKPRLGRPFGKPEVEEDARNENRREHGRQDTERQRDGKAADGPGTELVEDDRRDDRGHVCIENGQRGAGVALIHGGAGGKSLAQLLAYALVDQHVGVHGHTEGEDDTRNTWQGKRCAKSGQASQNQEDVERQNGIRHHAGEAIVDDHKDDHEHAADERGVDALIDGLLTEGRTNRPLLQDVHRCGQCAGAQHDGQVVSFFSSKGAGDGGAAAGDTLLDDRRGVDLAVQHDGHAFLCVFASETLEQTGAAAIKGEHDVRLVVRVERCIGVGDVLTSEHSIAFKHYGRLGIGAVGFAILHHGQLIAGRQDALLRLFNVRVLVHHLEFEVGCAAENLDGAFLLRKSGQLDLNAVVLALLTDVGLGYAELVNTVANGLNGLIQREVREVFPIRRSHGQGVPDLAVIQRGAGIDLEVLKIIFKNSIQSLPGVGLGQHKLQLVVLGGRRPEDEDALFPGGVANIASSLGNIVLDGLIDVYPQGQVHTALKVEAEIDFGVGQDLAQGGFRGCHKAGQHIKKSDECDEQCDADAQAEIAAHVSILVRGRCVYIIGRLGSLADNKSTVGSATWAALPTCLKKRTKTRGVGKPLLFLGVLGCRLCVVRQAGNVVPVYLDGEFLGELHVQQITLHGGNAAVHAPAGDDVVAFFEIGEHGLVLFRLLLLRTDEQEVEDDEHKDERRKGGDGIAPALSATLGRCAHGMRDGFKKHTSSFGLCVSCTVLIHVGQFRFRKQAPEPSRQTRLNAPRPSPRYTAAELWSQKRIQLSHPQSACQETPHFGSCFIAFREWVESGNSVNPSGYPLHENAYMWHRNLRPALLVASPPPSLFWKTVPILQGFDCLQQQLGHLLCIGAKDAQDFLPGHGLLVRLPAVVIRAHGHGGVRNAGLVGQNGFRRCGHVDDVRAPRPEHVGLGAGGKARTLDGNHRAARMVVYTQAFTMRDELLAQCFVKRIGHGRMHRSVRLECFIKCNGTVAGEVDELIEHHEVTALDFQTQGPHGRGRQNALALQLAEGVYVGAVVHGGGRHRVLTTVPGDHEDVFRADLARLDRRFQPAPRVIEIDILGFRKDGWVIQTTTAYNADALHRVCSWVMRVDQRVSRQVQPWSSSLSLPSRKPSSTRNPRPTSSPFTCWTSFSMPAAVPPVASRSSITSTFSPSCTAS